MSARESSDRDSGSGIHHNHLIAYLDSRGIIASLNDVTRALPEYYSSLSNTYYPKRGPPQITRVYRVVNMATRSSMQMRAMIVLPRSALRALFGAGWRILCKLPPVPMIPDKYRANMHIDFLYADQKTIIKHILNLWFPCNRASPNVDVLERARNESARTFARSVCLNLRAGYGKTFIAAGMITTLGARALYVVSTCELARQALSDLTLVIPQCGVIYAKSADLLRRARDAPSLYSVCIVVINTLLLYMNTLDSVTHRAPRALAHSFGLVILDEVHTLCSETRAQVFWYAQTRFMFGMSATVNERRDGRDFMLEHHLHPLIDAAQIPGFTYGSFPFTVSVRVINYYGPNEFTRTLKHDTTGMIFVPYMIDQFARDPARSSVIVHECARLLAREHNVFIFCGERAHCEQIARDLERAHVASTEDKGTTMPRAVIFYSGIDDDDRALAVACNAQLGQSARVLIATYGYSGTGVSIVRMTAIILASPRYSTMKQIVGRILRRGSDTTREREVVDIVDSRTCLARQFTKRCAAYNYYGATYKKVCARPIDEGARECVYDDENDDDDECPSSDLSLSPSTSMSSRTLIDDFDDDVGTCMP